MPSLEMLHGPDAAEVFKRCCHSSAWVNGMLARRPFPDTATLFNASAAVEATMTRADWLDAFDGHPRIGGDVAQLRAKFTTTAVWSEGEQSGVQGAPEETLEALAAGNRAYEEKFGHIFIVCATGKTAEEMLQLLHARLPNSPETELTIAAGEQAKITRIRLEKP